MYVYWFTTQGTQALHDKIIFYKHKNIGFVDMNE